MYGFGGLGEVEVEIWSDVTIAGRTKKDRATQPNGPWTAEMSKKVVIFSEHSKGCV